MEAQGDDSEWAADDKSEEMNRGGDVKVDGWGWIVAPNQEKKAEIKEKFLAIKNRVRVGIKATAKG